MENRTLRREHLFRFMRVTICIGVIIIGFYLYLPPRRNQVETMNATVGKEHVDVLCVGSSHMYNGLNTIQMYEETGLAAYCLSCGSQAPWQSYYYIVEACKHQKPRMIIYDAYMMGSREVANYKDYQTVENLLDWPLSIDKTEAVMMSLADSKLDILLRFPYFYDKYESFHGLTVNKFYGTTNYSMGYHFTTTVEAYTDEIIDVSEITEISEVHPQIERYLRKIIEFCQQREIALILVNAPWPGITVEKQARFNFIASVAREYGVPFIDGCRISPEIGIDYSTDFRGDGGHMNHSGVTKFTGYVNAYIRERYDLPDRRENPDYNCYNKGVEWLKEKVESDNKKK